MLKEGYLASNSCYLSISHTEQIIDAYLYRLDKILNRLEIARIKKTYRILKYPVSHSDSKDKQDYEIYYGNCSSS